MLRSTYKHNKNDFQTVRSIETKRPRFTSEEKAEQFVSVSLINFVESVF